MSSVSRAWRRLKIRLTGHQAGQRWLERRAARFRRLMGIGAGGSAAESGERALARSLRSLSEPELCVFDVGANRGQFLTMMLQDLGGRRCRFHAFEPGRRAFELLQAAVPDSDEISLNNIGLGARSGEGTLYFDKDGSELASLTRRNLEHLGRDFSGSETVTIDTLEDYCTAHGVTRIDLLKLDVEGHELDVLRGGRGMFERGAVRMVSFEFGGCNIDTRTYLRDFYHFFGEHGMRIWRITPSGFLYDPGRYTEALEQFETTNYCAAIDPGTSCGNGRGTGAP